MSTPATALSLLPSADPPPVYAGNGQLVLACPWVSPSSWSSSRSSRSIRSWR